MKRNNTAQLEQLKRDMSAVFNSKEGKRVLQHLENVCFMNKSTFSATRDRTILNEGMRYVVVHIRNIMNFNLEKIKQMINEEE